MNDEYDDNSPLQNLDKFGDNDLGFGINEDGRDISEPDLGDTEDGTEDEDILEGVVVEDDGFGNVPSTKGKLNTRLNQLTRTKNQLANELAARDRALQEKESQLRYYKQTSEDALHVGLEAREDSIKADINNLTLAKLQAMEDGDYRKAEIINSEIIKQTNESSKITEMKKHHEDTMKNRERDERIDAEVQQNRQLEQVRNASVEKWARENEHWANDESPQYDEHLAEGMQAYAENLNNHYVANGMGHLIRTPEYFQYIDSHKQKLLQQRNGSSRTGARQGDLNMKRGGSSINRVGNSGTPGGGRQGGGSVQGLTPDERMMARRMGMSEKNYLQGKIIEARKNR